MSVPIRFARTLAAALVLCAITTGCIAFSGHFGTPIPTERLERLENGVTTREQVAAWFGPPSAFFNPSFLDVIFEDEEDIMALGAPVLDDVYTYRYIENRSTIFFVPLLFGVLDARAVSETLTIFFDEEGRVRYHAYRRDGELDAGGAAP